ncbi:cytochrome c3 family protein [Pelagicoccus mobilis]|uniref:Doubled CXXCH motif domain-containing protein n=1 Tax=Pelagicoccus mobilis TaxID=415221 RepID=A0A934S647_9BACT|nr:cytochrome c3 family protein [Pelagicoccus mobilis]MBK1880089.1 hypothetical protein [Pelagicoccus mobilis]
MNDSPRSTARSRPWSLLGLIASALVIAFLAACNLTYDSYFSPPQIPGATFTGVKSCEECHEEIVEEFEGATHAKLLNESHHAINLGCEACHGPASTHNESGGEVGTIHNPKSDPDTCYQCHLDVKGSFNLAHAHPIGDKVSCNDCHDPHSGAAIKGGGVAAMKEAETCIQCHQAQSGPYVFEHEATRDGCTVCHSPHGSPSDKLLKTSNQMLCLQCHFQQQTAPDVILIGGRNHASWVSRGTCWTAGCHESVHGSHVNSSLRY